MAENAERNLRLFQELLTCVHNVYFWTYDIHLANLYTNCPDGKVLNRIFLLNEPQTKLLPLSAKQQPVAFMDSVGLNWIVDYENDAADNLLYLHVIGPVFIEDISVRALERTLRGYGLSPELQQEAIRVFESLPVVPFTRFVEYGIMMHYCITGRRITMSDYQYPESHTNAAQEENPQMDAHGSWALEQKLLKLVEDGNPDYKKIAGKLVTGGNVSALGNGNSMRHFRNITIIFTTLCTRAAIRGGLTPEVAFTLSDKYIRGVEACTTLTEVAELNDAMQEDFVQRVYRCKLQQQSPNIQKCCNYIQTHLADKCSVPELAEKLGYSESYLSKKFKKETGKTLSEYITEERIRAAKTQLVAASEDLQTIGVQLGFASQSYFGAIFKRYTGMSPGEYREHWRDRPETPETKE